MRATIRAAAVAGGMLTVMLAAGCATQPSGPQGATVATCTAYGVRAIQHHVVVKWQPAACRGLTKAEINFAVGRAIYEVAGSGQHKAAWRRRAAADGVYLAHMLTAVPRPASTVTPPLSAPAQQAPVRHGGAIGIAALITWLITVSSGAYMMARWIAHGGLRRRRTARTGLPPAVIFSHFGMATAGLVAWIIFLATNWTVSAWTAAGLLMPVTGLGISLVTLSAPARFLPSTTPAPVAVGAGVPAGPESPPPRPSRGGASVWLIAGHGVGATITILLVLLAALSTR